MNNDKYITLGSVIENLRDAIKGWDHLPVDVKVSPSGQYIYSNIEQSLRFVSEVCEDVDISQLISDKIKAQG